MPKDAERSRIVLPLKDKGESEWGTALHGSRPRRRGICLYLSLALVALAAIVVLTSLLIHLGSTGPLAGARLLFGNGTAAKLDECVVQLDEKLQVGMQVLEDSLCNWQKSPEKFQSFRG